MQQGELAVGLSLSNRGVVRGFIDAGGLVDMAEAAEACGGFDSVFAGDAFLVNPRLDSITLLAAVAARTKRVTLGPACMGSFTQRDALGLAYEWASLDHLAGGRTVMVACVGGGSGPAWAAEGRATGVAPEERRPRMWERIRLLRRLWSEDDVTFDGRFHRYENVTIAPKPVRRPYPIWVASNATRLASGTAEGALPVKTLGRVGAECDGWMTHSIPPAGFARAWAVVTAAAAAAGKDPAALDNCLYHNICVDDDEDAALAEGIAYLNDYYGADFSAERTRAWLAYGPPRRCADQLRAYAGSGVRRITLRLASRDQERQFRRLVDEVLPLLRRPG